MRQRLLTLNAWALPGNLSYDVDGRMRAIAHAIAELQPDIVALQELWHRSASARLVDALHRSGLEYQWTDGIGLGNGGLAVAARYPITRVRFTRYRVQGKPEKLRHGDYYAGKGFVEATVELAGSQLTVFNTHVHSRHVSSAPHLYTAERTAQLVELASAVERGPSPGVVAGDFNMTPTGPLYDAFRALSGCGDAAADGGTPHTTHFHHKSGRRERLDYVFVKNRGPAGLAIETCKRALDEDLIAGLPVRRYSDHAAVVADFEFPAAVSPRIADETARQRAIAWATAITHQARGSASGRQSQQRYGAAACLGLLAGGVVAHHKLGRRRFIKAATYLTAGLSGLASGGLLALSEYSSQRDLDGFEHVLELLDSMREPAPAEG